MFFCFCPRGTEFQYGICCAVYTVDAKKLEHTHPDLQRSMSACKFQFWHYVPKLEHSDWTGRNTQCGCHQGWAMDDMDIIMLAGGGAPCGGETT